MRCTTDKSSLGLEGIFSNSPLLQIRSGANLFTQVFSEMFTCTTVGILKKKNLQSLRFEGLVLDIFTLLTG